MKKKFLLYVSSIMCLSLGAAQISNAMQPGNNHSVPSLTISEDYLSFTDLLNLLDQGDMHYLVGMKDRNTGIIKEYHVLPRDHSATTITAKRITVDVYNQFKSVLLNH